MLRPSAAARGYGWHHQVLRKRWALLVELGGIPCARCGGLIQPGTPWDLGHDDLDRSRPSAPEHRRCNRSTSTHKAARRAAAKRDQRRWSRDW